MLFRLFQVRHALQAQFSGTYPTLPSLDVLEVLYSDEPRQLISVFYNMFITPAVTKLAYSVKHRWVGGIGKLDDED